MHFRPKSNSLQSKPSWVLNMLFQCLSIIQCWWLSSVHGQWSESVVHINALKRATELIKAYLNKVQGKNKQEKYVWLKK